MNEEKKTPVEQVRQLLVDTGGVKVYGPTARGNHIGCPSVKNLAPELQGLTQEETNIAFYMGWIGTAKKPGTIVAVAKAEK